MHDTQATRTLLDLITGAWRTQAVHAAAALRLPDHVHAGRTTSASLAEATGSKPELMHRLMRLLVELGVFEHDDHAGYRATAVSDLLRDIPGSLRPMCLLYGEEFYRAWGHAADAFVTGTPGFDSAYGTSLLAHLSAHPDTAGRFQQTMQVGGIVFDQVPDILNLTGHRLLVDIGGGNGELLSVMLSAAPHAHGVLVDLPYTIPLARSHLSRTVGLHRVTLIPQDMRNGPVPRGGDLYLLSRVLGGQTDETCVHVLTGIREAMAPDARVLILDRVLTDAPAPLTALWDLHLLMTNGGRERTLDDYRSLLAQAGLTLESTTTLPLETRVLLATGEPG